VGGRVFGKKVSLLTTSPSGMTTKGRGGVGGRAGFWEKSESVNYIPFGDVVKKLLIYGFRRRVALEEGKSSQ
jgi:hypothetical protein